METYRTITVVRSTPSGDVTEEHQLLARRLDPNDLENELPVDPTILLRVSDGGERIVELQAADVVSISLD